MAVRSTLIVLALALFAVAHGAPPTREELGERAEERAAAGAPHMPVLPRMKADFEKLVELRKEAGDLGKPMLKEGAVRMKEQLAAKRGAPPTPEAIAEKLSKFSKGAEKRKMGEASRKAMGAPPALPEGFKAPPAFAKGMKKMAGDAKPPMPMMGADKATWSPVKIDKAAPLLGADEATWSPTGKSGKPSLDKFAKKMAPPAKRQAPEAPHALGERLGKDAKRIPKMPKDLPLPKGGLEAKRLAKKTTTTAPPAVRERSAPTPPPKRAAPRDAPKAPLAPLRATTAPAEVRARAADKKLAPKFDGKPFKGLTHGPVAKRDAPAPKLPTPAELKAKFGSKAKFGPKVSKPKVPELKLPTLSASSPPPKFKLPDVKNIDMDAFKAKLHASLDSAKVAVTESEKVEA